MRVVLISREHPADSSGGGIGTYTLTMAQALAGLGHEVTYVTHGDGSEHVTGGVRVVGLAHRWLPNPTAERVAITAAIARRVSRLRPDVIQASEWDAEAWWLARRRPAPLVTRLATPTYLVEALNGGVPDRTTAVVRRMERYQALHSDALVAPSRALAERVAEAWGFSPESVEVIANPIDGAALRRAAAATPPVCLPERFILFIGRLERRKGVETLARALPAVLEAHPTVDAVILGRDAGERAGDVARDLRERTARFSARVHILGELPRDQAMTIVGRAELVVLPSLWEAFGFVAVEAMALERPVVAGATGGFSEIVRHGVSGWLVPPGDVDMLAATLIEKLGRRGELARVANAGRVRSEDFEASRLALRLVDVYERVIDGRRRGGAIDASIYRGEYRRHFRPEEPSGPFHRLYERKRDAVLEFFARRGPMQLIDVGCGPGRLTAPLATRHHMTGCDLSAAMLQEARSRCPPSVRLVEADARNLPFADGEFDGLLALDLLPHLPDLDAGLAELARVVRPGGPLVFDTSNAAPWWVLAYPSYVAWRPKRLLITMFSGGVLPEWRSVVRHDRAARVERAIGAAGLELGRMQRFGPPWTPKWHLWYATKPVA
jgi:glycogen(starch) synthase